MHNYVVKRIMHVVPVLAIIVALVFVLMHVSGDPVLLMLPEDATDEQIAELRSALNLDKPFIVQFGTYLTNALKGDFGRSFRFNRPALPLVLERLPVTAKLAFASILFSVVIGVPLGVISGVRRNSFTDLFVTTGSLLGKAMPNFWVGIMLILFFSVNLRWLPVSGSKEFRHLILPAITLGTSILADVSRLTRSSLLEVLGHDYIRTARGKGLAPYVVVYKHALKNALVPVVTIVMMQTSALIGGALVTESIFAWPGLGQLLVQSIHSRDMAIVQAAIFIIALLVLFFNLLADLIIAGIDPRIRYE